MDCFHASRPGNQVVDDVPRRVQQDTLGHRGHKGDQLYGIRRLLLTGEERLTDRARERIRAALAAGDPDDKVWYAWCVKELLRAVYRASDEPAARMALTEFYDTAKAANTPECDLLVRTIRGWNPRCSPTTAGTGSPTDAPKRPTGSARIRGRTPRFVA